ncbi:MAG: RNA polymerase sigma factor (sigma-70 family) [Planctomycetota bacterium]|jgi:RNA polymerase sigma factor (sigma-70 family)
MAKPPVNTLRKSEMSLQEAASLRRLARQLLYDPGAADDVVQEAWLSALKRGANQQTNSGWLRGAVRLIARQRGREESRRKYREQTVAETRTPVPSSSEISARLESTRRLIDAVETLAEPYRSVVVMRYFDDLPPREIAKLRDAPVETIRTQLQRGLTQLRRELSRNQTESMQCLAALLPLAGSISPLALHLLTGSSSISKWSGSLMMSLKTKTLVSAVMAAVLLTTGAQWMRTSLQAREPNPVEQVDLLRAKIEAPLSKDEPIYALAPGGEVRVAVADGPVVVRDWIIGGFVLSGGAPVLDCPVHIQLWRGYGRDGDLWQEQQVETDAMGRYAAAFPQPDDSLYVEVRSRHSSYLSSAQEDIVVRGEQPPAITLNLYLADAELLGRVVDDQGRPIAHANIDSWYRDTSTDANGQFRLPCTTERTEVQARVIADGFVTHRMRAFVKSAGEVPIPNIVLARESQLNGTLRDESGMPVAAAAIIPQLAYPATSISDEFGAFRIHGINGQKQYSRIYIQAAGYVHLEHRFTPEEVAGQSIEITLKRGLDVHGVVSNDRGTPLEGVLISLDHPPDTLPNRTTYSGRDGLFTIANISEGDHKLFAQRNGFAAIEQLIQVEPQNEVLLTMTGGQSLGGVVLNDSDEPLQDVWIIATRGLHDGVLIGGPVKSDEKGRFHIETLPDEPLMLTLIEAGFARKELQVRELNRNDMVVRMRRAGRLAGRVVDGRTGEAIPSFQIRLVDPLMLKGDRRLSGYGAVWADPGYAFKEGDGSWQTGDEDLLPDCVIGIEASADGYAPGVLARVVVTTEPKADDNVIQLYPGATLRGSVVSRQSGEPIEGALVRRFSDRQPLRARFSEDSDEVNTKTDLYGRFELNNVMIEEMSLSIEHPDFAVTIVGPLNPRDGQVIERTIELDSGLCLRGLLLTGMGEPMPDKSIVIYGQKGALAGRRYDRQTDRDGAFELGGLTAGRYQVSWFRKGGSRSVSALTTFVTLTDSDAEVELKPLGQSTVRGSLQFEGEYDEDTVMTVSLVPIPSNAESGQQRSHRGDFSSDGSFEFTHVEAGSWIIQVHGGEGGARYSGRTTVDVPTSGELVIDVPCKRY